MKERTHARTGPAVFGRLRLLFVTLNLGRLGRQKDVTTSVHHELVGRATRGGGILGKEIDGAVGETSHGARVMKEVAEAACGVLDARKLTKQM